MSVIPNYSQGSQARFDFRISNGLGSFCEPDWDDPDLRVEFFDSAGGLKFSATKTSNPPLEKADDREGIFLFIEGISLQNFSPGVADAHIYCRLNGEEVLPYPTIMEAFQVILGSGSEPVYSSAEKVRAELPAELPAELTDGVIEQYIYDASRRIDAVAISSYKVPFPGIEENPGTPALIERLCRKLAVIDCLIFLGTLNEMNINLPLEERVMRELMELKRGELRIAGYEASLSFYQGSIYQEEYPGEVIE